MSVDTRVDNDIVVNLDSILESPNPAHRIKPWMAVLTYGWRSLLKIKHVPEQLIDAVFAPLLFVLMLTYVFGGAIAGSPEDYLQYGLAGVLSQSVVFLSIYTALNVNTDINNGVLDRFRMMPCWRPAHLVGTLKADGVRYGIAAAVSLTVACVSSMFVPPETMPTWLQAFVNVNPMTFLADAVRNLMNGDVDVYSVVMVGLVSAVMVAVFAPTALWIYNRSS